MERRRNILVLCGGLFAIASLLIWSDTVVSGGEDRGWLGVSVQEVSKDTRNKLDLERGEGVEVCYVVDDSPADFADLESGDVILAVDGVDLKSARHLSRLVRKKSPGEKVSLAVIHDGKRKNLNVELVGEEDRDEDYQVFSFGGVKAPGVSVFGFDRPYLGVHIQDLSEDLAKYFNVDAGDGVLITDIEEDSPAQDAGLKAGDIFAKIGGEEVVSSEDVLDILSDYDPGDEVELTVIRSGREQKMTAELEGSRWGNRGASIHIAPHENFRIFDFKKPIRFQMEIKDRIHRQISEQILHEIQATKELRDLHLRIRPRLEGLKDNLRIIIRRHENNLIKIRSKNRKPGKKSLLNTI